MADSTRTFPDVRCVILSAHKNTCAGDKMTFYNEWAENYEQDVAILDYRAPVLAAECLSESFQGDREKAVVLDVACGTGLVCTRLKQMGFHHFVGLDGSDDMLKVAKSKGIYQELKQCILGTSALPFHPETYDVVLIVGALSDGQVPVTIIRELWKVTKPAARERISAFCGLDGRDGDEEAMLKVAWGKEISQELKQCILGTSALPLIAEMFDTVAICWSPSLQNCEQF